MVLIDPFDSMLSVARQKLKRQIDQGIITNILQLGMENLDYFNTSSFDTIIMSQTIHFADCNVGEYEGSPKDGVPLSQTLECYKPLLDTFQHCIRILKPGGVLIISDALPHQMYNGRWYAPFLPDRVAYDYPRTPTRKHLELLLKTAGFHEVDIFVDMKCPLTHDRDVEEWVSINDEEWRACDSSLTRLSQDEINDTDAQIKQALKAGKLNDIMAQAQRNREQQGMITIFIAQKDNIKLN